MTPRSAQINGKGRCRRLTSSPENAVVQARSFMKAEQQQLSTTKGARSFMKKDERLSTTEGAPSFMRGKERFGAICVPTMLVGKRSAKRFDRTQHRLRSVIRAKCWCSEYSGRSPLIHEGEGAPQRSAKRFDRTQYRLRSVIRAKCWCSSGSDSTIKNENPAQEMRSIERNSDCAVSPAQSIGALSGSGLFKYKRNLRSVPFLLRSVTRAGVWFADWLGRSSCASYARASFGSVVRIPERRAIQMRLRQFPARRRNLRASARLARGETK
jgi:hypothetical protein